MLSVPATKPEFECTNHRQGDQSTDQGACGSRPEHEREGCGDQVHAQPDPAHVRKLPVAPRRKHLASIFGTATQYEISADLCFVLAGLRAAKRPLRRPLFCMPSAGVA